MITECRAFEGGYCRQLLAMVDRRSFYRVKFHAVFLALKHQREGWILVDTGYGLNFPAASRTLPYRFYRWATPVTSLSTTTALLSAAGIPPKDVGHVIITHFHADHIGGLSEFPHATIHFQSQALDPLQQLSPWRQTRAAFLTALVPPWLDQKAHSIPATSFSPTPAFPLPAHDLFADGSLQLISLPGHAPGHIGVAFQSGNRNEFYAADAYWRECQLSKNIEPLGIAMMFQWDKHAYRKTVTALRTLHAEKHYRLTACHDHQTAMHFNGI